MMIQLHLLFLFILYTLYSWDPRLLGKSPNNLYLKQFSFPTLLCTPAGEQSEESTAKMSTAWHTSWAPEDGSCCGGRGPLPDVPKSFGLSCGSWRTNTHRHSSMAARQSEEPGSKMPVSSPSPTSGTLSFSAAPSSSVQKNGRKRDVRVHHVNEKSKKVNRQLRTHFVF